MSQTQHCHPLDNPGTSQIGRLIQALLPETFQIDERSIQDLIVEAHKFAKTLHFYDGATNKPSGSYWEGFWEVEILTYLAVLSVKDTDAQLNDYRRLVDAFKTGNTTANKGDEAPSPYQPLLEQLRDMAVELEQSYQKLQRINHPLQDLLLHRIRRENASDREELQGALARLISYHKGAVDELDPKGYQAFLLPDGRWGLWGRVDYDAISAQPNFNLEDLEEIFASFYDTWLILKTEAQKSFDAELARMERPQAEEYRVVQPHIALFLVFLRLFRYAQESLNELGAKHLDYYYQEILGIQAQDAVPDEVYLIFELAKDFNQHVLEKGTPLLGGKDANGRPLIYQTAEDWVVRAAKVADIKTTWIDSHCGGIHAQPDVNKVYELGEERPNETAESWRSMGDDPHLPTAELGFAIASPQLILREGERNITVVLQLCQALSEDANMRADYFKLYLSSTEEWVSLVPETSVDADSARGTFDMAFSNRQIKLNIKLERDAPPIDHLGEDLAEVAGMDTRWPILKVVINPELKKPCPAEAAAPLTAAEVYAKLQPLVVVEATITVDVKGIRENLIIQSDQGIFDGTQKVYPFGPTPQIGNRFYIGSTEVFQKALDDLVVRFKWIAPPESFPNYYAGYRFVNPNLYPTPNPQMLIEFVDRAEEEKILLTQVVRTGANSSDSGVVRMKVSDVNLDPLGGVVLIHNTPEVMLAEIERGIYTLSLSSGTTSWNGVNLILNIANQPDEEEPDFEPLELSAIDQDDHAATVPASLEVVFFPQIRRYIRLNTGNSLIRGFLTNIYGERISGDAYKALIDDDGNNALSISQGMFEYSFNGSNWPTKLSFWEDEKEITSLALKGFSIISAVLPFQAVVEEVNDLSSISSGGDFLVGVVTNGALEPQAPPGEIKVAALLDGKLLIATKTRSDGTFRIPVLAETPNTVEFYYADNETEPITSLSEFSESAALRAKIAPKPVQQLPGEGNLTIKGTVVLQGGSNDLSEEGFFIEGDGDWTISLQSGEIHLEGQNVVPHSILTIGKDGYKSAVFSIERFTSFRVALLKNDFEVGFKTSSVESKVDDQVLETTTTSSQKITVDVLDLDGNPLEGITVIIQKESAIQEIDTPVPLYFEFKTNDEGRIEFVGLPEDIYYIKALRDTGGKSTEITDYTVAINTGGVNLKMVLGNIEKALHHSSIAAGIVLAADGQPLEGVKVTPKGLNKDNVTYTNTRGLFRINIDEGEALEFYHPSYEGISVDELWGDYSLEVHMSPLNTYYVIEGEVQDIYKAPLSGARISASLGEFTEKDFESEEQRPEVFKLGESSVNGFYQIAVPVNAATSVKQLVFEREGYKTVVFPFPAEQVSTSVSYSLMNVRMRYDEVDYRPMVVNGTMQKEFDVKINALNVDRDTRTQHFERYSPTLKRGFLRFTLEKDDFRHQAYPKVLTLSSLMLSGEQSEDEGEQTIRPGFWNFNLIHSVISRDLSSFRLLVNQQEESDITDYLPPNPPYTPATNNISLDYTSTQVITGEANEGIDQFYHLLPFNGHRTVPLSPEQQDIDYTGVQLIYPYTPADSDAFRYMKDCENNGQVVAATSYAEGHLYIGLSNLTPGGTLSLLFTVAKGSAPSPEASAPELYWSYLAADNQWLPFQPGEILKDSTNGLTRTGMIQFQIPTTAVSENTMLNPSLYWIQASAKVANGEAPDEDVRALPSLSGIHAQVVLARFANDDNELSHLGDPLPADTISNLVEGNIAVKKIAQPLPSFGGRLPEQAGHEFMRRVSERLRHKDRAVSRWDYEHLLLQAFNEVQRAKCIPHTRYRPWEKASESAPGFVSVAVIPRLDGRTGHALAEPRFTQGKLDDMATHLAQRANLFVAFGEKAEARLQVVNPLYEKVDVKVKVAFQPGDEVYFKQQLTEALTHYISPWLADASTPPVFDRTLDKSAILQFVEEQPYVDYVELEGNTFVIRKTMTDLAGRPLAEKELRTLEEKVHGTANEVEVRTVRSQKIDGKVCTRSERSILIAGTVYVNSTKDAADKDLPAMPREIVELNGSGTKQPVEEEPVQQPVVAVKATGTASRGSRRKTTAKSSKATGKTASKRPAKGRKSKAGTSKKGSTSSRQSKKKSTRKKKGDSDS